MRKVLQQLLFISASSFLIISCEKGEEPFPPVTAKEKTLVHFPEAADGPIKTLALDLNPGVTTLKLLEIRREATSPAELNKKLVIKIKHQNSVISDPTGGQLTELPGNLYTNDPSNPFDGQFWTVTFQPGEFVTHLKISLDPTNLLSVGTRVGLGFLLAETPGAEISASANQLGVEISAKNAWDGVYSYNATLQYTDPCWAGPIGTTTTGGPLEMTLITTSANTVKRNMLGLENFIFWNNCSSNLSFFTNVIPAYQINSNNSITVLTRPGSLTFTTGSPATYNPATKTFSISYSLVVAPSFIVTETMVYLRPR